MSVANQRDSLDQFSIKIHGLQEARFFKKCFENNSCSGDFLMGANLTGTNFISYFIPSVDSNHGSIIV